MSRLLAEVRGLLAAVLEAGAGTPVADGATTALARLDEPLRVAIAGKVKAGKSTLLNALVGEELAPTDASECTRIVTWYEEGLSYRATVHPHKGNPRQVPFSRAGSAIDVDLGDLTADEVERLVIDWPSPRLREITLIDTPGIASLSTAVSARAFDFLAPEDDEPTAADAVLYLMRHLHAADLQFLESFHDSELAQPSPINAIGVLSRADEIGSGRLDAMTSAGRIAARYRFDPRVRRLCQTVVPVAGLLAQAGVTLREDEFQALRALAGAPRSETDPLFLSADRFASAPSPVPLAPAEREHLLLRFGLYGVRVALTLLRVGGVETARDLATALVARSGLDTLRDALLSQFANRRDVLKSRSALAAADALLPGLPAASRERLTVEVERIHASAHEFREVRLLQALRAGTVRLRDEDSTEAERMLGVDGTGATARLGLPADAPPEEMRAALVAAVSRWQRRAEHPLSSPDVAEAARILVRTCEGLLVRQP